MIRFVLGILIAVFSTTLYAQEKYSFSIAGTSGWVKSPYSAVAGKEILIAATGQVSHSWLSGFHGPQGNSAAMCVDCRVTRKCNVGGLIVRIGEGPAYCVDPMISGQAPASGPIYFSINDFPLNDNEGSFEVMLAGPGIGLGGSKF